ncbi:hypothetical protein L21SP5_03659 [Salinivirga cyanobacteriivorans]|uniref:Uncharacterized protein n=1 Tax=Salinivirga cyanobacteriivorans TaxID=1307839 RepID=A0A0S2I4Y0_9BACT|nr:hypothetical protein [Salinivirga cyanobacteriivorans]ALO17259.1 hypothetical protein L21SP5_03659 [Salinivirga cyanobacteriivorans]
MKSKISDLLIQIISVTIGVFLGFLISNWADTNKKNKQTKLLRNNVIAEIKNNKKRIENVIVYHKMLRDSARHYWTEDLNKPPNFFDGIKSPTLTNGAFETGIQTGLVNGFSFDEIQNVNNTYTVQTSYNELKSLMLSSFMNLSFDESSKGLKTFYRILAFSMTDVVYLDEALLEDYNKLLEQLKAE